MVNLRETWKSKIEVHCVKPQIQDQSKWVRAKKSFQLIWWAFSVFKGTTIPLLPSKPHQTSWHYFPYIWTKLTKLVSQAGAFPGKTLWIPNIWSATPHKDGEIEEDVNHRIRTRCKYEVAKCMRSIVWS